MPIDAKKTGAKPFEFYDVGKISPKNNKGSFEKVIFPSDDNVYFRLEKRKGEFKEGTPLDIKAGGGTRYLGVTHPLEKAYKMGFEYKDGIFARVIRTSRWGNPNRYFRSKIFIGTGDICNSRISPFDKSLFGNGEILKMLVGDFNRDDAIDVAYVVNDPKDGLVSYILYGESLGKECASKNWAIFGWIIKTMLDLGVVVEKKDIEYLKKTAIWIGDLNKKTSENSTSTEADMIKAGIARIIHRYRQNWHDKEHDKDILGSVKTYLHLFKKYRQDMKRADLRFQFSNSLRISPANYYSALMRFDKKAGNKDAFGRMINLLNTFCRVGKYHKDGNGSSFEPEMMKKEKLYTKKEANRLAGVIIKLGKKLRPGELEVLLRTMGKSQSGALFTTDRYNNELLDKIAAALRDTPRNELFLKLYRLFDCSAKIEARLLLKYSEFFANHIIPVARDIEHAEETIGHKDALRLWKEFKIVRFGRYHATMLRHLVGMLNDKHHKKERPLVHILVGRFDDTDIFYWGKMFKYDPRVRIVVNEYRDMKELLALMWKIRREYGIPDALLITDHGTPEGLSNKFGLKDMERFIEGLKDKAGVFIYGDRPPQAIANACSVGAPVKKGQNFAQALANALRTEVSAARADEIMIGLKLRIDNGRARLTPVFFELGGHDSPYVGLNFGGMQFLPCKDKDKCEAKYEWPADVNTGGQFNLGLSIYNGDFFYGGGFGLSKMLGYKTRLRFDANFSANKHGEYIAGMEVEAGYNLTNHVMGFLRAIGGVDSLSGRLAPHFEAITGLKLLLPTVNSEMDLGLKISSGDPKPSVFYRFQTRF